MSDLLLVRWEDRDQAMMVSTVRRSTATRLHVMTATVEEDREELRGTEGPVERPSERVNCYQSATYCGSLNPLEVGKEDLSLFDFWQYRKMFQLDPSGVPVQLHGKEKKLKYILKVMWNDKTYQSSLLLVMRFGENQ